MNAIQRNGGTAGIVTAVLFVVLLAVTFRVDPQAFTDAVKSLEFARNQAGLKAVVGIVSLVAAGAILLFFAGVANRLGERTPTRSAATNLFGIVGAAGLAVATLADWQGVALLANRAARDQAAAQYAWLALSAMSTALYGVTGAFIGAAVLASSWAIIATGAVTRGAGWMGILAGIAAVVGFLLQAALPPESAFSMYFYSVVGVLILIWFFWVGAALRRA